MTNTWLNADNIRRSTDGVEHHPLVPFLPKHARVLFLGSFPPQRKRWCMNFYYPNFINDHWRIEGEVFFGNRQYFVIANEKRFDMEKIVCFCQQQGIAFYDTACAVRRLKGNAADEFLEIVQPTDIHALLTQLPYLEAIVATGQKATDTLCKYFAIGESPKVGASVPIPSIRNAVGRQVYLYRLPSSSRAYPLSFDKKATFYRNMFLRVGIMQQAKAGGAGLSETKPLATEAALPQLLNYDLGAEIVAFSTTRQGGCSHQAYSTFNINPYCGDSDTHIRFNREALCRLLAIDDDRLLMPHQTHGTHVAIIGEDFFSMTTAERTSALENTDALMTSLPRVCIGVSTADCIPVLIYDPAHRVVCAIHAGWRGTVARITEKAVAAMSQTYGSRASDLRAQIGPGISLDSFEVGQEVYQAFADAGFNMSAISRRYPAMHAEPATAAAAPDTQATRWHIDLHACNRQQLMASGVRPEAITLSGICTYQQHHRFFSARRLGVSSGRIFTGIMLRPAD